MLKALIELETNEERDVENGKKVKELLISFYIHAILSLPSIYSFRRMH